MASSKSGWIDTDLRLIWTNNVIGQFSFTHLLLAWDTYECHLMPIVQASLKPKTIDTVLALEVVLSTFRHRR